jgi:hypothetical protein
MKVWIVFLLLGLSTAGFLLNVIRYEHRITELTARADSLQAVCEALTPAVPDTFIARAWSWVEGSVVNTVVECRDSVGVSSVDKIYIKFK